MPLLFAVRRQLMVPYSNGSLAGLPGGGCAVLRAGLAAVVLGAAVVKVRGLCFEGMRSATRSSRRSHRSDVGGRRDLTIGQPDELVDAVIDHDAPCYRESDWASTFSPLRWPSRSAVLGAFLLYTSW